MRENELFASGCRGVETGSITVPLVEGEGGADGDQLITQCVTDYIHRTPPGGGLLLLNPSC